MVERSSSVLDLITDLKALQINNPLIYKRISHPDILFAALEELDSLVEMDAVKLSIIQQVYYLLFLFVRGKGKMSDYPLHSVLYGPPGVGKSHTAKVIAQIWYGIGLLEKNTATSKQTIIEHLNAAKLNVDKLRHKQPEKELCEITLNLQAIGNLIGTEQEVVSSNLVVICSRQDFVGEWAGHTAVKTTKFLTAHKGHVIVVEEAYLLHLDAKDTFGMEAISTIIRFMDNNPDTIFIFAGYKDLMDAGIFKAQPGLLRRCQWFFELKGYSAAGLADIFYRQLKLTGWDIVKQGLVSFFENNKQYFGSFGGDTSKLAFHCKLVHSRSLFNDLCNNEVTQEYFIKENQLQAGMAQLILHGTSEDNDSYKHIYI